MLSPTLQHAQHVAYAAQLHNQKEVGKEAMDKAIRHKDLYIEVLPEGYRVRGPSLMPRPTPRQALLAFSESPRTCYLFKIGYGPTRYRVGFKRGKEELWILFYEDPICDSPHALYSWPYRPGRRELAQVIRAHYRSNPFLPSIYGWREWYLADLQSYVLLSPIRRTPWPTAALQAHTWSNEPLVNGHEGVHAHRCPANWRINQDCWPKLPRLVTGIVERFGRAVLGRNGWRAEHVVIRELIARDRKIALALSMRYPSARVWWVDAPTNTLKEVPNGN
jgi:hypothetical protein